jgi:hypothetical protein
MIDDGAVLLGTLKAVVGLIINKTRIKSERLSKK